MRKVVLPFAAASFSGLGGTDATAAPAFWQGLERIRRWPLTRASTHVSETDLESSGHLHPNDASYRVMGDGIDLKLFR